MARPSGAETQRFMIARQNGDVDYLIAALRHPEFRHLAATTLGELRAREAVPRLMPLLRSADHFVRIAAARALGRIKAREALGDLLDVAESDNVEVVRTWAIFAAGTIGIIDEVQRVAELTEDGDPSVATTAVAALAVSPSEAARALAARYGREMGWRRRREMRRVARRMKQSS